MSTDESADSSPTGSPAPDSEVTIEEVVLEHDNKLNFLNHKLQEQQQALDGLFKLLEQPSATISSQKPAPWNLKDGTPQQQQKILTELNEWIDWYNKTYPGVEEHLIPPCWYKHGAVVQELLAVFVAWQAAYCGLVDPDDAPASWHERILHPTIARLCLDKAAGWGNCIGAHREPHGMAVAKIDSDDFHAWLQKLVPHTISGREVPNEH